MRTLVSWLFTNVTKKVIFYKLLIDFKSVLFCKQLLIKMNNHKECVENFNTVLLLNFYFLNHSRQYLITELLLSSLLSWGAHPPETKLLAPGSSWPPSQLLGSWSSDNIPSIRLILKKISAAEIILWELDLKIKT